MNDIKADSIPIELQSVPQWVVWIWAVRGEKRTKIPINPKTKRPAAVNDPDTWSTFDEAYSLATRWLTPGGIGFVFTADDPYCGVDLDKCRDPKTGEFTEGAKGVIARLATYTEVSPSGTGAKMLCRAVLPEGRNRTEGIEFYDRGRFFTITGSHVAGTPLCIEHRQDEISTLHAEYFPPHEQEERRRPPEAHEGESILEDDELIKRISRNASQGPRFSALMAGDTSNYESASEADCAIVAIVGWWARGDRAQIIRIVQQSGLWRPKWERPDYQRRTLDAGLAGTADFYGDRRREPPAPERSTGPNESEPEIPKRRFVWSSELRALDATDKWVWEGYLSRGGITLFSALWKAGKTTLLAHLLKAFESEGKFCGLPVKPCKVLYVTEEDQGTWAERRDSIKLGDHVGFVCRPFLGRPNAGQWKEFIGSLKKDVEDYGFNVVVIDTLAKLWPVKDENAASQVDEALIPFWELSGTGVAILLVHHVRKGDGQEATASRGSGALTAFVETIVELRRFNAGDRKDHRRVLTAHGRYSQTPDELVVDLTERGYEAQGDRETCNMAAIRDVLLEILPKCEPGLTYKEIVAAWPEDEVPRKQSILETLNLGIQSGVWLSAGSGKKNDARRFWTSPDVATE